MTLEAFVRSAGTVMGMARESFGSGGGTTFAAGNGLGNAPAAPPGASGRAADGAEHESHQLHGHVTELGGHDSAGNEQLGGALEAAGAGRGRMDGIIDAAVADVHAMGMATNTPQGQAALVAAIKRHLEDTKGTLDGAAVDASTRAAGANATAAGYNGTAPPISPAAIAPAAQMLGAAVPAAVGAPASLLSSVGGAAPLGMLSQLGQYGSMAVGNSGGGAQLASTTGPLADRAISGDLAVGHAKGSEAGLQKDTILARRAISAAFPQIVDIGGVRPDSLPWHPKGQAIDCMIPGDPLSPQGIALGDRVVRFALSRWNEFHLNHVIWQNRIWTSPDHSEPFGANWGDITQAHRNHVHVATNGGGLPNGTETYRL